MVISRYLGSSLLVALWAVACGGSTDDPNPNPSGGSTSTSGGAAGSTTAGQSPGGTSNGGSTGTGGSSGATGTGGTGTSGNGSGGGGGTSSVDPRCPPQLPSGTCTSEQADALCEYDSSGCLCQSASPTSLCVKVDGACPGGGGADTPAPNGMGGDTGKIALPPKKACRCSGGSWQCSP